MLIANSIYKYGRKVNSYDLLKLLAITTMIIDHLGLYFFQSEGYLRLIGRMAAPLFFMLSGFSTSSAPSGLKKNLIIYALLLFLWQVLVEDSLFPLNILFNFILIKMILEKISFSKSLSSFKLFLIFIALILQDLSFSNLIEYGTIGLMFALYSPIKKNNQLQAGLWLLGTLAYYGISCIPLYNDPPHDLLIAMTVLIMIYITLSKYQFVEKEYRNKLILLISRRSIDIYFWHLILFSYFYQLQQ